ncbi:hypothetical protein FHQ28_05410 [Pasteurellaceae bacterium USgator11]|nr:hypothetical protein FHQ19_09385 [Pasteurellaceae bacterium UScroc12]TNG94753.1 hypothetical protein FHQ20_08150 [Pasteurellaceae bacterium USgator41]TNG97724.1 hypothetical protein FHQ24_09940 [Pasteurellaceae bacterium UScroc31]TNH01685.1 hypothetical protein FHQ28_05410 [Pasteurellaceae bacterium USgator11]
MLTEQDKTNIKTTILKAVENGCLEPELLLSKITNTLERINRTDSKLILDSSDTNNPTSCGYQKVKNWYR